MQNSIVIREEENWEEMLGYAKQAGFTEVSFSFGTPEFFLQADYKSKIDRMKEVLDQKGLVCKQTHLPFYHLTVSSEIAEETMELGILRCIEESARLGAEWTAYHPRTAVNAGYNQTKSFEDNRRYLAKYLETAEKYGVGIAIENMPLYPYEKPYWRFFGGGWEEIAELCDSFQSDKVGICWDFGHAHTAAIEQAHAIRDLGKRIKITHVHDNYRNGDHHQLPLMANPIWGCVDWKSAMRALREVQYEGALTLELIYPPLPMCDTFMKLAYECLENLKKCGEEKDDIRK